jgi:hypothetical protein
MVLQSGTLTFFLNYFYGWGIGWWLAFFIVAFIAAIYIFYDSSRRNLQSVAFWRIAVIVAMLLILPTIMFRFTVRISNLTGYFDIQEEIDYLETYQDRIDWRNRVDELKLFQLDNFPLLTGYYETIVYLGLIGSIGSLGLAVGYWLTFKDESEQAPSGGFDDRVYVPPPPPPIEPKPQAPMPGGREAYKPQKPKANAWLTMKSDGKSYQLLKGTTTIGRSSKCDIPIINDRTISNQHIKIIEDNGHFKLVDLGSLNGTWVNGNRVRQPIMLDLNDEIRIGDNTYMKFLAS